MHNALIHDHFNAKKCDIVFHRKYVYKQRLIRAPFVMVMVHEPDEVLCIITWRYKYVG